MEGYFLPYRYLGYLQPCKYWIKDVNECVFKMDHTQSLVFKMAHAQPLVFSVFSNKQYNFYNK